jgi:hypothetical protein
MGISSGHFLAWKERFFWAFSPAASLMGSGGCGRVLLSQHHLGNPGLGLPYESHRLRAFG